MSAEGYEYILISDSQYICELCLTFMKSTCVILYDKEAPSEARENITQNYITIVLCELDDETMQVVKSACRQLRVMKHQSTGCKSQNASRYEQVADSAAGNAVDSATVDGAPIDPVEYFDVSDFINNVPVGDTMFAIYMTDKILSAVFECCYKPVTYEISALQGKLLLDGIRFQNKSLGEALADMLDQGYKCFEREAEYCMIGRVSQQLIDRVNDIRMLYGQTVSFKDRVKTYKLTMGELPLYFQKYNNVIGVRRIDAGGMTVQVYPFDNEELEDLLLSHSSEHWFDSVHNYVINYESIGKLFNFHNSTIIYGN